MKIDRTGAVQTSTPAKRGEKAKKAEAGGFSKHMAAGAEATGASGPVSPVQSVDALLSIQEVDDATTGQSQKQARQWGTDVLDQLDRLRIGIISGTVARHDLERIAALVERHRARSDDPLLAQILDEIELRARVELAKFEQRPAGR